MSAVTVKMDSPNSYKPPRRFAVISPNLHQFHACFAVVKTDSPNFSSFLSAVRYLTSTSLVPLCVNQNRFSEPLRVFYTLGSSQNGLSEPLRASYTCCGGQKRTLPASSLIFTSGSQNGLFRTSTSFLHALR